MTIHLIYIIYIGKTNGPSPNPSTREGSRHNWEVKTKTNFAIKREQSNLFELPSVSKVKTTQSDYDDNEDGKQN